MNVTYKNDHLRSFITYFAISATAFAAGPPEPYRAPVSANGKGPVYDDNPAVYQYEYAVQDDYCGVNFGQYEHRVGYSTTGHYQVLSPDGRTQIHTFNRKVKKC